MCLDFPIYDFKWEALVEVVYTSCIMLKTNRTIISLGLSALTTTIYSFTFTFSVPSQTRCVYGCLNLHISFFRMLVIVYASVSHSTDPELHLLCNVQCGGVLCRTQSPVSQLSFALLENNSNI